MQYKKLYGMFKDFDSFLLEKNDNPKIEKSRLEILEIMNVVFFASMVFIIITSYGSITGTAKQLGTGFIMTGSVTIFIFWSLIQIHYKKKREKKIILSAKYI